MQFNEKRAGDIVLLTLQGNTLDFDTIPMLKEFLLDCIDAGKVTVGINMTNIHIIRTMGLGLLISAHKTFKKNGGEMKLYNLTDYCKELFELCKLDKRMDILDSEESVIQSFKG